MSLFSIIVDIAANTAALESGLDRATKKLEDFGRTVEGALQLGGAALGFGELISSFEEFTQQAEHVQHAAEATGLAVEQFSRLQFAAQQVGVSSDSLSTQLEHLAKSAALAETGGKLQAAAFSAMGLSVTDASGRIKPMADLLSEVADKFATYKDSAEKTALAQDIFGRAGAEMIPLLNLGAAGIQKLEQRSDELGNTLTKSTVEAAKQFNAKLGELEGLGNGVKQAIEAGMLPAVTRLTDAFVQGAAGATAFSKVTAAVAGSFKLLEAGVSISGSAITAVENYGAAVLKASSSFLHGDFTGGFTQLGNAFKGLATDAEKGVQGVEAVLKTTDKIHIDSILGGKEDAPFVLTSDFQSDLNEALLQIDSRTRQTLGNMQQNIVNSTGQTLDKSLKKMVQETQTLWDQLDQIGQNGAKGIEQAVEDFFFNPTASGFKQLEGDFLTVLRRMVAQAETAELFKALFGKQGAAGLGDFFTQGLEKLFPTSGGSDSGLLGGLLGNLLGPSLEASAAKDSLDATNFISDNFNIADLITGELAGGGPAMGGNTYLVGEHGPELFTPSTSGTVSPNGTFGGGPSFTFNYVINAPNGDQQLRNALPSLLAQTAAKSKRDMLDAFNRNGLPAPRSA